MLQACLLLEPTSEEGFPLVTPKTKAHMAKEDKVFIFAILPYFGIMTFGVRRAYVYSVGKLE